MSTNQIAQDFIQSSLLYTQLNSLTVLVRKVLLHPVHQDRRGLRTDRYSTAVVTDPW